MVKIEKSIFLKNLSIKLSKSVKIRVLSRYSFERKIKSLFALNRFLSVNIGSLSKTKTSKVKLAPLFQIPEFEGLAQEFLAQEWRNFWRKMAQEF